jgi:hypothetical protein
MRFLCNACGWHFEQSSSAVPQHFMSRSEQPLNVTTAMDSMSTDSDSAVQRVSETGRQIPLDQIFRGQSADAKLKRVIAMRYITTNPSQVEVVEWLLARKVALLSSWERYRLDDWADAWEIKPHLIKRLLSGITGKLRKNGYQVGRPYRM